MEIKINQNSNNSIQEDIKAIIRKEDKSTNCAKKIASIALMGITLFAYNDTSAKTNNTPTDQKQFITVENYKNGEWAEKFFRYIGDKRGLQYSYCPSLSNFARIRFDTMSANYRISHYRYEEDADKFYKSYIEPRYKGNLDLGEEILFPNSNSSVITDSPDAFAKELKTEAPQHLDELNDKRFVYYGSYIRDSTNYVVEETVTCHTSEISKPNIDVEKELLSQGCKPEAIKETWVVLETSNTCQ